jgi:hypothetical protein
MSAKIVSQVFQKLTTKRFVAEFIFTILEHLAQQTESKVDDKLLRVCRKVLLEEENRKDEKLITFKA